MPPPEETVLAHVLPPDRVPLATRVRGTVILASLRGLRSRGHGDRYLQLLDPRHHPTVESLTAGTWLPMDFALAHYEACDRLALDRQTIEAIGAESGTFINQTVLTVVAKLSTASGVTPWMVLAYANTLRARTWVGGSISITKLGPKDARLEWIQQPVARFPYFRTAFGAFTVSICRLFSPKVYVRELRDRPLDTVAQYRFSWV
jgi:hypothetical protein